MGQLQQSYEADKKNNKNVSKYSITGEVGMRNTLLCLLGLMSMGRKYSMEVEMVDCLFLILYTYFLFTRNGLIRGEGFVCMFVFI